MNITNYSPSPRRPTKLGTASEVLEKSIILNDNQKKIRYSIFWGTINACLLAVVYYIMTHTCPIRQQALLLYTEYFFILILTFNVIYYVIRYIIVSTTCEISNPVVMSPPQHSPQNVTLLTTTYQSTPTNAFTNISSNSPNSPRSPIVPLSQTPPSYIGNSTQFVQHYSGSSPTNISFQDASKNESISEEHCLAEYLKGYEVYDRPTNITDYSDQHGSVGNPFWSHSTATTKDVSKNLLKYQYQLSPVTSASSSSSPGSQSDDTASPLNNSILGMEVWRRFSVDKLTLTRWNANIRTWLLQTIVKRLINEIDTIDDLLQKHGLLDVKIGNVGIERLRKTAEMASILQGIPTLSILLSFLEVCSNQEYFIQRLRELSKGSCLSDFKWNAGSSYHGKDWNEFLPTDSDIIMHLFATYMDTQLLPNPNNPDKKAFSGIHYIKYGDNIQTSPSTLAIQQFLEKPPQYRVIVGEEIFEVMKGYNNLFHSILLFLYHVNKREHGMLGRINMGRAGINILWVIDS